jgi:hypothetical protein
MTILLTDGGAEMPNGHPKPKVLMLTDRIPGQPLGTVDSFGVSYSSTPDPTDLYFFSLSHLLGTLNADVTKAHRQTDPASDNGSQSPADIENFRFSAGSLAGFDQVWLIGYNSTRLDQPHLTAPQIAAVPDEAELAALTTFMNEGGGVFAVGDHAGLGLALSGSVPRVRTMRKWWYPTTGPFGNEPVAPPAVDVQGSNRLDSTRPGHTVATDPNAPGEPAVWFDDQSDDIPQYLGFNTQGNLCYEPIVYQTNPGLLHPLLQGPSGPILAFADHMHEGEVILPYEYDRILTFAGQQFAEYPSGPGGMVKPQIVAWSWTNGSVNVVPSGETGLHVGDDGISPYQYYGAVGAYDGSIAGVGRVVVESTFHHFMDINLIGDPKASAGDPKELGFRASEEGRAVLANIEAYYDNVVQWLLPPQPMKGQWVHWVVMALQNRTLREVATNPAPGVRLKVGQRAIATLARQVRPGMLITQLVSILPNEVRLSLPALPWGPVTGTNGCGSVDYHQFLVAALGEAVLVAAELANGRGSLSLLGDPEAHRQIVHGTVRGVSGLASEMERKGEGLVRLARALRDL